MRQKPGALKPAPRPHQRGGAVCQRLLPSGCGIVALVAAVAAADQPEQRVLEGGGTRNRASRRVRLRP